MEHHHDHQALLDNIHQQLKPLFDNSKQGMYVFLDDQHSVCNAKFAKLLGFKTPAEWAKVNTSFLDAYVAPDSQDTLANAYRAAMEEGTPSQISVTWLGKDGKKVKTSVTLAPLVFDNHLVAIHWVKES